MSKKNEPRNPQELLKSQDLWKSQPLTPGSILWEWHKLEAALLRSGLGTMHLVPQHEGYFYSLRYKNHEPFVGTTEEAHEGALLLTNKLAALMRKEHPDEPEE